MSPCPPWPQKGEGRVLDARSLGSEMLETGLFSGLELLWGLCPFPLSRCHFFLNPVRVGYPFNSRVKWGKCAAPFRYRTAWCIAPGLEPWSSIYSPNRLQLLEPVNINIRQTCENELKKYRKRKNPRKKNVRKRKNLQRAMSGFDWYGKKDEYF